jgi:hypothetical protein
MLGFDTATDETPSLPLRDGERLCSSSLSSPEGGRPAPSELGIGKSSSTIAGTELGRQPH